MSDGGRESGRDNKPETPESSSRKIGKPLGSGGDDFGRAIAKIAVAQICEGTGFHSANQSALDALADVAIRFICDLGKAAKFSANLANRTEGNVFDVIQGLEDLGLSHGFAGASDVHHCLVGSGAIGDIIHFVGTVDEVPFARPVPKFPIVYSRRPTPSFSQIGEKPVGEHIPDWLPALPDPHTYIHTPVWNERGSDLRVERIEQERQRRKAEKSLLGLQQRLTCNGEAEGSCDVRKGKHVADSNPFLAPPLPYGEKPVSEIAVASRDEVRGKSSSVLEAFAAAIEEKEGSLECQIVEPRVGPNKRPKVQFRLGPEKKTFCLRFMGASGKNDSWWLKDDEKDDRKRKAERILKEAMENGKELIQM